MLTRGWPKSAWYHSGHAVGMLGTAMHETNRSGGSGHRAVRPEELLARLNTAERQNAPEWLYVEGDTTSSW